MESLLGLTDDDNISLPRVRPRHGASGNYSSIDNSANGRKQIVLQCKDVVEIVERGLGQDSTQQALRQILRSVCGDSIRAVEATSHRIVV
jgi:hypothetical protein